MLGVSSGAGNVSLSFQKFTHLCTYYVYLQVPWKHACTMDLRSVPWAFSRTAPPPHCCRKSARRMSLLARLSNCWTRQNSNRTVVTPGTDREENKRGKDSGSLVMNLTLRIPYCWSLFIIWCLIVFLTSGDPWTTTKIRHSGRHHTMCGTCGSDWHFLRSTWQRSSTIWFSTAGGWHFIQ